MLKLLLKIKRKIRSALLNWYAGVSISPTAFIADNAKIDIYPDGNFYGGTVSIARGCRVLDGVVLTPWGGHITLDENVFIGPYSVLYGQGGLSIGKDTLIAGHVFITSASHSFASLEIPIALQQNVVVGVHIGEDTWIGSGVQIIDGVTIGKGCVVGAGAVVNKSLPDYAIAVGVPARVIGTRKK